MEKVYLIDGMSLVFRAYHAMLKTGMSSPSGQPTGALYGFINLMTSLLEKEKPDNIIVAIQSKSEKNNDDMCHF
jgi:DNA polymerase-1